MGINIRKSSLSHNRRIQTKHLINELVWRQPHHLPPSLLLMRGMCGSWVEVDRSYVEQRKADVLATNEPEQSLGSGAVTAEAGNLAGTSNGLAEFVVS